MCAPVRQRHGGARQHANIINVLHSVLLFKSSLIIPMLSPDCVQFTNGTVHVKASFDKSYELILMPLQAAVLLPFNDSEWAGLQGCRAGRRRAWPALGWAAAHVHG